MRRWLSSNSVRMGRILKVAELEAQETGDDLEVIFDPVMNLP